MSQAALLSTLPSQLTEALSSGVDLSHVAGSHLLALLQAALPHRGSRLLQTNPQTGLLVFSLLPLITPSSCYQVYFCNTQL